MNNKLFFKFLIGAILFFSSTQLFSQRCNLTIGDVNYYCGGNVVFHVNVVSDTPSYTLNFTPAVALGGDSFMISALSPGFSPYITGILTTASGCSETIVLYIDPYTGVNDTITICDTNMLDIMGNTGAESYLWSTGDTTNFTVINSPGIYWCAMYYPLCGIVYDTTVVLGGTIYYPPSSDPTMIIHMCIGDTLLLSGGIGGATYQWYSVERGMIVALADTTPTITVDTLGYFYCVITDFCGGTHSVYYFIEGAGCFNLVWPGDANADGFDNMYDFFYIADAYGDTGSARPGASTSWIGQAATDWTSFSSFGWSPVNFKHADCDGNGIVDYLDLGVNSANYGLTHMRTGEEGSRADNPLIPNVTLHANYDTCGVSTIVNVDIQLGDASTPIDSISAIVFEFHFDPALVDTNSISINYTGSWLGTVGSNMISFQKNLFTNARLDMGASRIDHTNKNGFGKLATVSFVTTDNLSGIAPCPLSIGNYLAITRSGDTVELDAINDTVFIDPNKTTGIKNISEIQASIDFYPNPSSQFLNINSSKFKMDKITIYNLLGKLIDTQLVNSKNTKLDVENFENGIYIVEVEMEGNKIYKKVEVSK